MNNKVMKFQHDVLSKMHKLHRQVDMELNVWRPTKTQVSRLLNLKEFTLKQIALGLFRLKCESNMTEIVVFCNHDDDEWVTEEIKQRKEVIENEDE